MTLACQPASYWTNPATGVEGNSSRVLLLGRGAFVFLGGFLLYGGLSTLPHCRLQGLLQELVGMFVLLSHNYGAASRCHVPFPDRIHGPALTGVTILRFPAFAAGWHHRTGRDSSTKDFGGVV
ncbi:MAG: hypothetical protein HYY93_14535 [Planctomycetes bacterium]|nr:hypothetical protein [Planctomycetota bacterium]